MNSETHRYGCHNRAPYVSHYRPTGGGPQHDIPTFGAKDCQFTLSKLGAKDPACVGCKWRKDQPTMEGEK